MAASAEFIDFLKEQMAGFGPVTHRRMFGGAGLYRDAMIFALVVDDVLYLKADDGNRSRFIAENLAPFAYETKTGEKAAMSYMRCPERCFDDPDEMTDWCRLAWGATLRANASVSKAKSKPPSPRHRGS